MGYKKLPNTSDSVQFIAQHLPHTGIPIKGDKKEREKFIQECLVEYHSEGTSCERKKCLQDFILMNTWYLFPYILSFYNLKSNIFEDTLQLMILTTMKAIENFKPDLGFKFSSYISGYLKDAVSSSLKSNMVIKCPMSIAKTQEIYSLSCTEKKDRNNKTSYMELNIDEDITLTEISRDIINKNKPTSLSSLSVEDNIINNEQSDLLRKAICTPGLLSRKERLVLVYRFGLSGVPRLTLSQVASIFRNNGERASKVWIFQIEQKAKAKLKRYFRRNKF